MACYEAAGMAFPIVVRILIYDQINSAPCNTHTELDEGPVPLPILRLRPRPA